MPSITIPQLGLSLGGSQCNARPDSAQPNIFSLALADNVIEDMIKCVRGGKSIQLCLGKDPKILYGSKSHQLATSSDPFMHELYRTVPPPGAPPFTTTPIPQPDALSTMDFWGNVQKKGLFTKVRTIRTSTDGTTKSVDPPVRAKPINNQLNNSPIAGADAALAALKNSLASEDARKKDNTTKYVKDSLPPTGKKRAAPQPAKATNKTRFLSQKNKSIASATTRSVPTSPALIGVGSPSLAPTSVPLSQQQAERAKATRRPVVHKLALGPASEAELLNDKPDDLTAQEFKSALDKVADLENGKWVLKSKAFKELDVFSYRAYSTVDRQAAIENAIRAYDKLRLNAAEPEWEKLLPPEERGTGKCLSKLQAKIAGGGIQLAKAPKINVHRAEESGRDTPVNTEGDNVSSDKPSNTPVKGGESMARSYSNPGATKSKRVSEKEAQTKRLLAKPGSKTAKTTGAKPSEKRSLGKESTKIKSSEFVGDSDDEDDNNFAPLLAAVVKPTQAPVAKPISKPAVKRAREDAGDQTLAPVTKKTKAPSNTSPQKSSPLASSPPTNVSDVDESSSSNKGGLKRKSRSSISSDEPITKRHQISSISSDEAISKRHQKSVSSSSSSSVNSVQGALQNRSGSGSGNGGSSIRTNVKEKYAHIPQAQRALNAHKFNAFYKSYKQLHLELSMTKTKDKSKMAELLEMQDRLTKLKKEVLKGLDGDEAELESGLGKER